MATAFAFSPQIFCTPVDLIWLPSAAATFVVLFHIAGNTSFGDYVFDVVQCASITTTLVAPGGLWVSQ